MSKRKLPEAKISSRQGLRSEVSPAALDRWNPDVMSAADDEAAPTISILDVIGDDWFGEGVTAKKIAAQLRAIGERDVVVDINSPGGDLFEGLAIYNMLREHRAAVTVRVLGLAASAAALIAMAGDTVQIARAGFLMIHNVWVVAMGDRHELREAADWLEPFDGALVDIFSARSGVDAKKIATLLDRETWINGADAVDQGFADEFLESDQVNAPAKASSAGRELHALREIETYLAIANCPRSKRGSLVKALKGGLRDAAAPVLRDADFEGLLAHTKQIGGIQ